MPQRRVTLSTDNNPTYAWFVPLCALMWREVADFHVSCIFVGGAGEWLEARAKEVGAQVHVVMPPRACSPSAASQLIRLFSYLLPGTDPDDYLLNVDADAWPLANAFAPSGADLDLIYPDACDLAETPYFPIGYIGAKARVWHEVLADVALDAENPVAAMESLFATDPALRAGHGGWNYDETLVTRKIKAWCRNDKTVRITRRQGDPPIDRVDRSAWPATPIADGFMDAHLVRPGWTDENWPRLRPLLAQRLSAVHLAWADDYRAEWCHSLDTARRTP